MFGTISSSPVWVVESDLGVCLEVVPPVVSHKNSMRLITYAKKLKDRTEKMVPVVWFFSGKLVYD